MTPIGFNAVADFFVAEGGNQNRSVDAGNNQALLQLSCYLHSLWCFIFNPCASAYTYKKTNQKPFYTLVFVLCAIRNSCCNDFSCYCSGNTISNCRNYRTCCRNNSFIPWRRTFPGSLRLLCSSFYSRNVSIKSNKKICIFSILVIEYIPRLFSNRRKAYEC